jgi:MFS family permease
MTRRNSGEKGKYFMKKPHYAWKILAACSVLNFVETGLITNTSALFIPLYVRDVGLTMTLYTVFLMLSTFIMAIMMPFTGKVFAAGRLKPAMTIAAIAQVGGITLRSQAAGAAMYAVGQCLVSGSSAFLMGMLIIPVLGNWFEKKLGFVNGVVATIGGLGGVLCNPVVGFAIEHLGWRRTQLINAGIVLVTVVPIALFVLRFTPKKGETAYGADEGAKGGADSLVGPSFGLLRKSSPFWLLAMVGAFLPVTLGLQQMISPHLQGKGYSTMEIAFVMSAIMVGTTIAQPIAGILIDKFNQTAVILGLAAFAAAGWLGVVLLDGQLMLAAAGVGIGISAAFMAVVLPVIRRRDWGGKGYAQGNALSGLFSALVPAISLIIVGVLADSTGSYAAAFISPLAIMALCAVWTVMSKRRGYGVEGSKLNQAYKLETESGAAQ